MRSNVRRLVMDQVVKVRQHFKREEWKSIISECRASGMTVKAWCKANGIVEQTYYKNLKKLREEMIENLPAPVATDICEKPTIFKKLEVQSPLPNTREIYPISGNQSYINDISSEGMKIEGWISETTNEQESYYPVKDFKHEY